MNSNQTSDAELLERIATRRDEEAFHLFRDRYATDVRDLILRTASRWGIGLNRIDPEVIWQKVFEKLWASPGLFAANPVATLMTTAHHKLIDATRNRLDQITGSLDEMESRGRDVGGPPPEIPFDTQILNELADIVDEKNRPLFVDCYLGDMTYPEVAKRHQLPSVEAVRKRIRRAWNKAKPKMKKHLIEKGITSSALADEIRILNLPPPVWRGVPQHRKTTSSGRARLGVLAVALFIGMLLFQRVFYPPMGPLEVGVPTNPLPPAVTGSSESASQSSRDVNSLTQSTLPRRIAQSAQATGGNINSSTRTILRSGVHDPGDGAGRPVLDQPGVRQAIATWNPQSDLFIVEHVEESFDDSALGLPIQSLTPGEDLEDEKIPSDCHGFTNANDPHKLVGVGLKQLTEVFTVLRWAKGNPKGTFPAGVQSEGNQADFQTLQLVSNWAETPDISIQGINLGDGWATLLFTATSTEKRIQQDGQVILRVIIETPLGKVWGAEKVIRKPPRPF